MERNEMARLNKRPPMIPHTDQQLEDSAALLDEPTRKAAKLLWLNRILRAVVLPRRPRYLYGTGKIRKLRIRLYERFYTWMSTRVQGVDFPTDLATSAELRIDGDKIVHRGTVFGKLDGVSLPVNEAPSREVST